ncbi:hypothetical protein AB4298_09740 [Shewanella sp. 10N.261.52.F9]|uniref:hypothetical protein n=1 Tax=Shewanella sp. 10N.261.52.F9 TaxID=3229684 RepID=UPI003551C34D
MLTTISAEQDLKSGGRGNAQLFLMPGSGFTYVTNSSRADELCRKYDGATDPSPIVIDGVSVPAMSECVNGKMLTYITDTDTSRWLLGRFWEQSKVVVDGWRFSAKGFQKTIKSNYPNSN